MRDMMLPAAALTAILALLLAYSASRPDPQLVWRFVDDSAAAKPLLSIERTGEHVDRVVFDRQEFAVSYRDGEIVVEHVTR